MKIKRRLLSILLAFLILLPYQPVNAATKADENVKLSVVVHQQTVGDSKKAANGKTAGTVGRGMRMEAVYIGCTLPKGVKGTIKYRAHVQGIGWQPWVTKGHMAGTKGEEKRLEAIQIKLTGTFLKKYDVYYRTYMRNCGWLDWAKNGQTSGTVGQGAVLEGIQVLVVKKNSSNAPVQGGYAAITPENLNTLSYSGHVQGLGDVAPVTNGQQLGTTGSSKRIEGLSVRLSHGASQMFGTLKYSVHCQTYGWMNEVREGGYAGTRGESKRIEAIQISLEGDLSKYCDIYYRLHVQTLGWLSWAKNGDRAGTAGYSYRAEAIQIKLVAKGADAPGSTAVAFVDANSQPAGTTTGYMLLAPYLDNIISSCTNAGMSKSQKLRAVFNYVKSHYLYRSLGPEHPNNFTSDEYYAYQTAISGSGNCYGINFLFGYLARRVGYPQAKLVRGGLGSRRAPHGWVTIDGYIYDPEISYENHVDAYCVTNGSMYSYYPD